MDRPLHPGLFPGLLVRHTSQPDWGLGQVQSVAGARVTVNFEHAGKITLIGQDLPIEPLPAARA
jgi:hypothetical protein